MTSSPREDDRPIKHRGCSCWLVVLVLVFLVLLVAAGAFVTYKRYLEEEALADLSLAERVAFQKWVNEPLDIPPELLVKREPLPAEIVREKDELFGKQWPEDFLEFEDISEGIGIRLLQGIPLSAKENESVTSYTKQAEGQVRRVSKLVSSPKYVLNKRTSLGIQMIYYDHLAMVILCAHYARASAYKGDLQAAADAVSTTLMISRHDPGMFVFSDSIDSVLTSTVIIAHLTDNTQVLESLLHSLNSARSYATSLNPYFDVRAGLLLNQFQQMVSNGYLDKLPSNRWEMYRQSIFYDRYLVWLVRNYAPSDPRVLYAKKTLPDITDITRELGKVKRLNVGIFKPLVRELAATNSTVWLAMDFKQHPKWKLNKQLAVTRYDLTRLTIARRIAMLRGEPEPMAAIDFVPRYLPEVPQDPFTSGPLQFSAKTNTFFSPGPDGVEGTQDDIFPYTPPALSKNEHDVLQTSSPK